MELRYEQQVPAKDPSNLPLRRWLQGGMLRKCGSSGKEEASSQCEYNSENLHKMLCLFLGVLAKEKASRPKAGPCCQLTQDITRP